MSNVTVVVFYSRVNLFFCILDFPRLCLKTSILEQQMQKARELLERNMGCFRAKAKTVMLVAPPGEWLRHIIKQSSIH